jgi:hypothetical protein
MGSILGVQIRGPKWGSKMGVHMGVYNNSANQ